MMKIEGKLAQLQSDIEEAQERAEYDEDQVSDVEILELLKRTRDLISEGLQEVNAARKTWDNSHE